MAESTADVFSSQLLESEARRVARSHKLGQSSKEFLSVYKHLRQMPDWIARIDSYCAAPKPEHSRVADWLLDNDYQVLRAIRQLGEDLPPDFYHQLPVLSTADSHQVPRVFAVAHAAIKAMRKQLASGNLQRYINAYQEVAPLTVAELWALPSMLRLASLEILADAFEQLSEDLAPPWKISVYATKARSPDVTDRVAQAISVLAAVYAFEWADFVDHTSCVEAILRRDPAECYANMDFQSRDSYRRAVERLAKGSGFGEVAIARKVIALANREKPGSRQRHVGFWLIDEGVQALEESLGYRRDWRERRQAFILGNAGLCYSSVSLLFFIAALVLPFWYLLHTGAAPITWLVTLLLVALPASVLSQALVQWLLASLVSIRALPAIDYRKGIPVDCKTAVVVPVIISRAEDVPPLVEWLELRRLANPDPMLHFVLLSDLPDSKEEVQPNDAAIEKALVEAVASLNERSMGYGNAPAVCNFYLLHRRRRFNAAQNCWMGWERKRGKIESFNRFVLSGDPAEFSLREGELSQLRDIKYVITLDADTMLPPSAAASLIGTIAHPLNKAQWDATTGQIAGGYSIIQPRLEVLPLSGPVSLFCRIFAGDAAIDIYSRAVSDLYQDLFASGSFVGKGIYEVASFQRSLENRVPENTILSHDLFEGAHARTALASNIILYENFPANYPEYALRAHRWIRGDWQLLPWLGKKIPTADGALMPGALSALDRFKMFDNLRRSLVMPSLLVLLLAGWTVLPGNPWLWTLLAALAPGIYLFAGLVNTVTREDRSARFADMRYRILEICGHWFGSLTFLVSDTLIALDAIVRTLWRLLVSRRDLLQWRSAAHVQNGISRGSLRSSTWRLMWPSSFSAVLLTPALAFFFPLALIPASPLLLLWFIAPEIAIWLGHPRETRRQHLNDDEQSFLFQLARRTWHFFEAFAGPNENWLPPDNFQGGAKNEVAHRTSPTNIGMLLTATTTARDFGFICTDDFVLRIHSALKSMGQLETYRGHIFNWYDTRTLKPLEPRYVSTVDSGNLAACLIVLKQSCLEYATEPVFRPQLWQGLQCTFALLMDALRSFGGINNEDLKRHQSHFEQTFSHARISVSSWSTCASELVDTHWPKFEQVIAEKLIHSAESSPVALTEVRVWVDRFHHDLHALYRQLHDYLPWLGLLVGPPSGCEDIARSVMSVLSAECPIPNLTENIRSCNSLIEDRLTSLPQTESVSVWLENLQSSLQQGLSKQEELSADLLDLASRAEHIAFGMDFSLLYDKEVRLFRIGFNVSTGQDDHNHYDLLASEARTASFFAIAKRDVPMEHWFSLGRPVTRLHGKPVVLSWTGSMFEYLMPALFMPGHRDTLLGESQSAAVIYQRDYAASRKTPWGISESAFAATDADGNYQYKAFGAPGLGLRRGLSEDLVIAPYATALALGHWPRLAVDNLRKLAGLTRLGVYGFIDALDFTGKRSSGDSAFKPVETYMAHHQGMIAVAIFNALHNDIVVHRMMSDKRMRTFEMLLQERIPWEAPIEEGRIKEAKELEQGLRPVPVLNSWVPSTGSTVPQVLMLGNGRMASWHSEGGAGGLYWKNFALTRWLPDSSGDCHGYWLYIKDVESQMLWSAGRLPTGDAGSESRTIFHPHMIEHFRRNHGIATRVEMSVAADDDVEIRRITLVNEGTEARTIEVTSYGEVVLAPPIDDERHPAFSKLFVGSEFYPQLNGLMFTRRPRRPEAPAPHLLHMAVMNSARVDLVGYETDRSQFIGRNGNLKRPLGLLSELSRTTGWTLDPIMALTVRATLGPNESASFFLLSIAGESVSKLQEIAGRYQTNSLDWAFRDAARMVAREVARVELEPAALPDMQAIASLLLQPHPHFTASPSHLSESRYGQEYLWHFGISGDLPILLVRMAETKPTRLLETLIKAQHLWRRAGLRVDIVVLRTGSAGYEDPLRETILAILRDADVFGYLGREGGVHLLYADHMEPDVQRGIETMARVILDDDAVPLSRKLDNMLEHRALFPMLEPSGPEPLALEPMALQPLDLQFANGMGGFDRVSGDYVLDLGPGEHTPAPWCNVLANDQFGAILSEYGLGFSWAANSGENRLTWSSNDPVSDLPGEALYLRDEVTARFWSVTPGPAEESSACRIRHGTGYTRWQKKSHGLDQDLLVFVPPKDPVKLLRLRLTNHTGQARRLTATFYAQWLLGSLGSNCKPHIVCHYDPSLHAIVSHNPWRSEFSERVAFVSSTDVAHSVSGDRYEFLGREGTLQSPAGLRRSDLGGGFNSGGDACAAYQVHLDLAAGESKETVFILGQGANQAQSSELITRYQDPRQIDTAFSQLQSFWTEKLHAVQVETPDPAFDLMVNRWLIYQTLASRMMARAGFYQASGAYGFRDQLQDSLALLQADPERVREHILRAAGHQFEAGDVQHWWHPPQGRGVRTHCSDDYIWLAYVTARYVTASADRAILDCSVPFLMAPPLAPGEQDRYARFDRGNPATLFEHCCRALDHMMSTGAHGLPLMGSGDWNDGMDRVGIQGRGESVWLAWFQIAAIKEFYPLAVERGATERADRWQQYAKNLKTAIDESAWDGEWYIRAIDDRGKSWGSHENEECRIDSISQSWAVLAGFGHEPRAKTAMNAARDKLLLDKDRLVLLLDPPFHYSSRDPGYIRAYPPGIRENGGQYSHAATWMGLAFAGLGDGDTAWQIFDILNPIRRALDPESVRRYQREPFVLAGDIYSKDSNRGRGGWSWYTGASAWTWQLGVEGILGLRPVDGGFTIDPCLPTQWGGARLIVRRKQGVIKIAIEDPDHVGRGVSSIAVNGETVSDKLLRLPGEGKEIEVDVRLGKQQSMTTPLQLPLSRGNS
ncbi:glucoamylase family protein [Congregibacter variabilis]|uniref:Glucoamylase family protein n=1 Tax=Congregibacter variabilis TaxID=3081200 RepID=A0ABZ0I1R4_9GAMM|nr:glucoamylase family protein [Congregibacter sp. IMCC43200]